MIKTCFICSDYNLSSVLLSTKTNRGAKYVCIQDRLGSILYELSSLLLRPSRGFCEDWVDVKEGIILRVYWGDHRVKAYWMCSGCWDFVSLGFACFSLASIFTYILLPVISVIHICAAGPQVQPPAQHSTFLFGLANGTTRQMAGWTMWPPVVLSNHHFLFLGLPRQWNIQLIF